MIAVRELKTADEVFANAKRVRDAFFAPRPKLQAQVQISAEHAANDSVVVPVTTGGGESSAPEVVRDIIDLINMVVEPNPIFAPRARAKQIVQKIACEHGMTAEDILGTKRQTKYVKARHEAIAAIYTDFPQWSLEKIAQFFNIHHTSVLHAIRKMGVWRGAVA